jgi:uncharacterized protein (DUF2164 family)
MIGIFPKIYIDRFEELVSSVENAGGDIDHKSQLNTILENIHPYFYLTLIRNARKRISVKPKVMQSDVDELKDELVEF